MTLYNNWNEKWIIKNERRFKEMEITSNSPIGYSTITPSEEGNLTISALTTTAPGKDTPVVIHKDMVFDASCTN
jgi:hypothetical protein